MHSSNKVYPFLSPYCLNLLHVLVLTHFYWFRWSHWPRFRMMKVVWHFWWMEVLHWGSIWAL